MRHDHNVPFARTHLSALAGHFMTPPVDDNVVASTSIFVGEFT